MDVEADRISYIEAYTQKELSKAFNRITENKTFKDNPPRFSDFKVTNRILGRKKVEKEEDLLFKPDNNEMCGVEEPPPSDSEEEAGANEDERATFL